MHPFKKVSVFVILLSATVAARASVLTVGPGGTFAQIQDAVDAANDGDIVLVEPGGYLGFVIDDKGVSVVADTGGGVQTGMITVKNVAAGRTVVLAGITFKDSSFPPKDFIALNMANNQGSLRCEDCSFLGTGAPNYLGRQGAYLSACHDAAFIRCSMRGGWGSSDGNGQPMFGPTGSIHPLTGTAHGYETARRPGRGTWSSWCSRGTRATTR